MSGVLVHEWIAESGGSENVLEAFSKTFPDAPVVCLWNDSPTLIEPSRLTETWLARTRLRRHKALAMPFMVPTWRRLPRAEAEWALVSSHLFAHHARFRREPVAFRRFVYVHTPARYIWAPELDGRGSGVGPRLVSPFLRRLDRRRVHRGPHASFAANSQFIRERVRLAWDVDARVIHPPVEVTDIQARDDWTTALSGAEERLLDGLPEGFLLGASRFVPYKRLDLVIQAGEATGRPVVLAGRGPDLDRLRSHADRATVPVHFVDFPSTSLLRALYQRTACYVFPAIEDFGIMPVEAMAAGAPVVAHTVGGGSESVLPGVTGDLSDFSDPRQVATAVENAVTTRVEPRRQRARDFSVEAFEQHIREWVGV